MKLRSKVMLEQVADKIPTCKTNLPHEVLRGPWVWSWWSVFAVMRNRIEGGLHHLRHVHIRGLVHSTHRSCRHCGSHSVAI